MQVYTLQAFAKNSNGGNPAGVVLVADTLTSDEMQRIATMVGMSETAFVSSSKVADFKVRFFTPKKEVDLCGHATIATFYLMRFINILKRGTYTQETKAGILKIDVDYHHIVMEQPAPIFSEKIDKKSIAKSLNIPESAISDNLPIQIVSTGLRDIIVPINSLKELQDIAPAFDKIKKVSEKYNTAGYHCFTLETLKKDTLAHCRNFAPLLGVPEEAATGSASGALGAYLALHGVINESQKIKLEQGYNMSSPSEIVVDITKTPDGEIRVKVGGTAENIEVVHLNYFSR